MKNIFKKILNRAIYEYKYIACHHGILKRNAIYKNKHKSKRCFVIGNGASLGTQDLSLLKNEVTFVMSGFWKHPVVEKWQPTYYCFADPMFFDGSKQVAAFFNSLRDKIKNTTFFVPIFAKDMIEREHLLPLSNTSYVNIGRPLFIGKGKIDLTSFILPLQNVAQMAIQIAMYMGCNPIFLIGLDHDWLTHRGMDKHFYPTKTVEDHPLIHGDMGKFSYKGEVEACLEIWKMYERLLKIANKNEIKIINATNGGFLDVFERVHYESLF